MVDRWRKNAASLAMLGVLEDQVAVLLILDHLGLETSSREKVSLLDFGLLLSSVEMLLLPCQHLVDKPFH